MIKNIIAIAALAGFMALPAIASAEIYQYVAYTGDVRTIVAPNPIAALDLAPDLAYHSGVILVDQDTLEIPPSMTVPVTGIPAQR